ncbi:MAG TPA: radical SAM protein [Thermoplasmata archaeon]|nr:radical SAM protein [Thermoplasmata archaeon]
MTTVTILDGYVDEPTCLGVPPYLSPYPRYIAGGIWNAKKDVEVHYITIDQLRNHEKKTKVISRSDVIVVVAGMVVPGRYLSGFPMSPREITGFLGKLEENIKVLCGPAAKHGFGVSGGKNVREVDELKGFFDLIIKGDPEVALNQLLLENLDVDAVDPDTVRASAGEIREYAIRGARIVTQHPNFPDYLIVEIETYRGCSRTVVGGCSFCSEPLKGLPDFRSPQDIIDEMTSLYKLGVKHFRLGSQPCIFSYMSKGVEELEFPQPNPEVIEKLFKGIRTVAPQIKTLHVDNANPGVIARYPEECRRIAKSIVRYHTPGDIAAFGVESADLKVIRENNLKATPDEVIKAVRLINDVGRHRGYNGLPEFLPGINLVFGLKGESKETFECDYEFLRRILDEGLLVRRINLRQAIPLPGTRMYDVGSKLVRKHKEYFKRFKRQVRENIDRPMLKKIVPSGTVLKDVYTEIHMGKTTFARQLGSYPILVGIPGVFELNKFIDVKVVDHGYRSITALPYPFPINTASKDTIEALPDVGRKRVSRILVKRPFSDEQQVMDALDDPSLGEKLLKFGVSIEQLFLLCYLLYYIW